MSLLGEVVHGLSEFAFFHPTESWAVLAFSEERERNFFFCRRPDAREELIAFPVFFATPNEVHPSLQTVLQVTTVGNGDVISDGRDPFDIGLIS